MAPFLKPLLRIAQTVFVLFLFYFAFRLFHYHLDLVTFPYSNTLREGAMMTSTDALVKGLNPYAMSLQPRYMNQYGIIYPLLVWPWAKIFGTTILIHRIVTAFFILASCSLIFLVLKKMSVSIVLNIWAVLMLYSSLMYPGTSTPTIDPGATGMFFFLLTIFIPWACKYSYQSLMLSVLFGVIAFYSKVYDFLGALIMLSYLFLFISRIKGLFYGFFLLSLFAISIMVVNQILPAYFDNCFFASANMAPAWMSVERLHEQIRIYTGLHQWTLLLVGAFILGYLIKNFQSLLKKTPHTVKEFRFPLVLYAGICSAFVLYMSLGRHSGAMLWYFFQLFSPFLLISAVWLFNRSSLWPFLCVPFLIYNLHVITADQNYKCFNKSIPGWQEISTAISQHQHILNSPLIAPLMIEQNKDIVDDGQAEYFLPGGQRNYWMKGWLKEDERVYIQQMLFFDGIRHKVENKEYDLIILQPSLLPLGVGDDIRKYYKFEGQILLYAPQDRRPYALTVWKPL